ncbi:hypothetical protein TNCV_4314581 [Trichonephila clavipes]|nr:hypothetical protein TNCV_4314581 [Trichonephila clavipes]
MENNICNSMILTSRRRHFYLVGQSKHKVGACGVNNQASAVLAVQVSKRPVHVGSLFIVWTRNDVDNLTGSHNGQGSAHRVKRDEACLTNASVTSADVERMTPRIKGGGI